MRDTAANGPTLSAVFANIAGGNIDRKVTLAGTTLAYTTVHGDTYAVTIPSAGNVYISARYPSQGYTEPLHALAMGTEEWAVREALTTHH